MNGFAIMMFIFALCVLLVGLYMFTGHELSVISWKAAFKGLNKDDWKNIGKWTMITSVIIFCIGIIVWFFNI